MAGGHVISFVAQSGKWRRLYKDGESLYKFCVAIYY